jgi:TRAP-type C4-dicarboxylate transport system permease large subunit
LVALVTKSVFSPAPPNELFVSAALGTSVVMFLVAAALVSSWLITVAEIATQVVDLVRPSWRARRS